MELKINRCRFNIIVYIVSCLLSSYSLKAQIPPLIFPLGAGVNIHFTRGHEKDLDMIADAGFKFVRMDFSWSGTERKRGEYDFSAYDELTTNLEKRGIRALYILDYSNPLYEDIYEITEGGKTRKEVASPQKPESVAAFARWAGEAARHFKGRKIIWEIWNEPNISFWKPKPDVQKYITLAEATIKAVRAADPDATIIAPASSEFPWKFLESMFQAGLIEKLDGISVHPYRSRPPETVESDYARLRSMIERYASPAKRNIPIISGEWGYATHLKGVSLETQAAYIVRQQLINLMLGIPISIWYDWKNDGTDPAYNEHNFGTVTADLQPKPSYIAIKTAISELNNCKFIRRLTPGDSNIYTLLFNDSAGGQKLAIWTTGKSEEVTIKLGLKSENELKITLWDGKAVKPQLINGILRVQATQNPQFITLLSKSRELTAAGAWEIERPLKSLVEAGDNGLFQLPVILRNPFDFPIYANLDFTLSDYFENRSVRLPAGKSEKIIFKTKVFRRDLEAVKGDVKVEYLRLDKELIGKWEESFTLAISNPMKFEIAPAQNGLKFIIENPFKSKFSGTLIAGKFSSPIVIDENKNIFSLDVPVNAFGDVLKISLLDKSKREAAKLTGARYVPLTLNEVRAHLDGDSKILANLNLSELIIKESPFEKVWALDYEFESGWRFIRVAGKGGKIAIEGKPVGFGVWINGDNSGNVLRMRVRDSEGQTFQPTGPSIDWTGWKWVKFNLLDLSNAGHWGGANDGIVRGDLSLDTLLIVDGGSKKTRGKIMFCGFTLIYEK